MVKLIKYYEIKLDKDNYDRLIKLIEKDEANRVKMRERSQAKASENIRGARKTKINFELIGKYEIECESSGGE